MKWRNLAIDHPHMRGQDVALLQRADNIHARSLGFPTEPEDWNFGPKALIAARRQGYWIGAADRELQGPVRPHLQQILRAPWRRTPAERARGIRRYRVRRRQLAEMGAYVFPLPTLASVGRVDRGQDMETAGEHDPFVAIGDAVIVQAETDFPGIIYRILKGPRAGREVFHGHTHACFVSYGEYVRAGQEIGEVGHQGRSYDGGTTHIEIGRWPWSEVAPGTHHTATGADFHRRLHQHFPDRIPAQEIIA